MSAMVNGAMTKGRMIIVAVTTAWILIWWLYSSRNHISSFTKTVTSPSFSSTAVVIMPTTAPNKPLQAGSSPVADEKLMGLNDVGPLPTTQQQSQTRKDRPLVLFAFFETELARRNLEFFIAHALNDAADFVFVLNGETDAEKLIPTDRSNIRYVKRRNECYDMGAFAEVLTKDSLYKKHKKFIMMNASVRGPFMPVYSNKCWMDTYLERLTDKIKLVGMTMSCWPRPHIQSMIWAMDSTSMELMLYPPEHITKNFNPTFDPAICDENCPVPPVIQAGMNFCPHGYWDAVSVEVYGTAFMQHAGYEVAAMMTAFHSLENHEKFDNICGTDRDPGDPTLEGRYWDMNLHPFETVFAKTNRGSGQQTLAKFTEWADNRQYSSYDVCK